MGRSKGRGHSKGATEAKKRGRDSPTNKSNPTNLYPKMSLEKGAFLRRFVFFFSYMDHCSFFSPMCSPRGGLWKTVLRGETGTTQFPFSDVTDHKLSSNLFYDRLLPHVGGPVSKGKGSASVRKDINRRRYRGKRPPSDQTLLTQIPPTSYSIFP